MYLPLILNNYATGWVEVGRGSATNGGISDNDAASAFATIVMDSQGKPYVAWLDEGDVVDDYFEIRLKHWTWHDHSRVSMPSEIYVRRWYSGTWNQVGAGSATGGGISNDDGESKYPSIAVTSSGTPYIAWHIRHLGRNHLIGMVPAFCVQRSILP